MAIDVPSQKMSIGIMVRDCHGEVIACLSALKELRSQPVLAEIMSLWCIVEFCEELGLSKVQLEGDAQIIIDAVKVEKECSTWFGGIIDDVKIVLS